MSAQLDNLNIFPSKTNKQPAWLSLLCKRLEMSVWDVQAQIWCLQIASARSVPAVQEYALSPYAGAYMLHVCPIADAECQFANHYSAREAAAMAPITEMNGALSGLVCLKQLTLHESSREIVKSSVIYTPYPTSHVLMCSQITNWCIQICI